MASFVVSRQFSFWLVLIEHLWDVTRFYRSTFNWLQNMTVVHQLHAHCSWRDQASWQLCTGCTPTAAGETKHHDSCAPVARPLQPERPSSDVACTKHWRCHVLNCRRNVNCGTNSSQHSKVSARRWNSWRNRKWNLTCRSVTLVSRALRSAVRCLFNQQVDVLSTLLSGSVVTHFFTT